MKYFQHVYRFRFENEADIEVESVKLRNDPSESCVENLISLPYLHEPAILYCLQQRYEKGDIYTYTGPILIALNPFKRLPLYSDNILETYYNAGLLKSQGIENSFNLAPHVFAIADAAYRDMMNVIIHGNSSQSATAADQVKIRRLSLPQFIVSSSFVFNNSGDFNIG